MNEITTIAETLANPARIILAFMKNKIVFNVDGSWM
jgi:hypothetical protein